jgi:poly-gamma-glutamate synthesis protein (capsule biosynthesis protein)
LARLDTVDAIMFVPHWGVENTDFVLLDQIELAHEAFVAGATAILGAHPHVLQHWEKLTANGREGLVIYSLGNFISDQRARVQRIGAIARLELLKEPGSRAARLSAVGYLPTYVEIGWVHQVRELRGQERQLPLPRGNRMRLVAPKAFPRACEMHNPAD